MVIKVKASIRDEFDRTQSYTGDYATILVTRAPAKRRYLKINHMHILASHGEDEIFIDPHQNTLQIDSMSDYKAYVVHSKVHATPSFYYDEYQNEYMCVRDEYIWDEVLQNVEDVALWVCEHKATIRLARVSVYINSVDKQLLVITNKDANIWSDAGELSVIDLD